MSSIPVFAGSDTFSGYLQGNYYGGELNVTSYGANSAMWGEPESSTEPNPAVKLDGIVSGLSASRMLYANEYARCSDSATLANTQSASVNYYCEGTYVKYLYVTP